MDAYNVGFNWHVIYYTVGEQELSFGKEHGVGAETGIVEVCVDPFPHWYSTVDFSTMGQVPEDQRLQIIKNVRTYLLKFYYRCKFVNKEGEEVVRFDDE